MSSLPSTSSAKVLGLFGSGLLSGGNLYVSLFAIPALLSHSQIPPNALHAQWLQMYNTGKATFPAVSIMTAAAFGFLSWHSADARERLLFTASAASTLAIIPFTLLGMKKNLRALLDPRKVWGELDRRKLRELIVTWGNLNYVRSGLLMAAFGTALAASMG